MSAPPSASDVREAHKRISHGIVTTPCRASLHLSALTGTRIYLKHENLQLTSSFKDRGALSKLPRLDNTLKERGVTAMSAGNHAQAVACHARRLKVPATIVMPETTPIAKSEKTRRFGAEALLRIRLEISDDPGNLGKVCALLGELGVNIVDIDRRRVFAATSARAVDVSFLLRLRRPEDRDGVLEFLDA